MNITDTDILLDLEGTRGIDSFLGTIDCGFFVPKVFAPRVIKIIKTFYDVDMVITNKTLPKRKGTFCLLDFDDISVQIKNKEYANA